jgi:uncharacterized phage-associated protein
MKETMSVKFRLHLQKVIEASALLLKLHGKPMKYIGLLKMLYIADRIALSRMEQPITGDDSVSMKYGPVLSGVYDLIKGKEMEGANLSWQKFIVTKDNNVELLKELEIEELCEEEVDILTEVYNTFGKIDPFKVAEWTHDFPEWQDPKIFNKKAIPISIDDILKNIGKSDEEIAEIRQEALREAYLDEVLHG